MQSDSQTGGIEQAWWYEGSCPNCGKAVADTGDEVRCVGCGAGVDRSMHTGNEQ